MILSAISNDTISNKADQMMISIKRTSESLSISGPFTFKRVKKKKKKTMLN